MSGRGWEAALRQVHNAYASAGRAIIHKTDPPVRQIRPGKAGKFYGCFSGTGPVDFWGCIKGGRTVAFDAKHCSGKRWPYKGLEPHQARKLRAVHSMGGLAFVALRMAGSTWVLPWAELDRRWTKVHTKEAKRGEMSVSLDDLKTWAIKMPMPGDWLGALTSRGNHDQ